MQLFSSDAHEVSGIARNLSNMASIGAELSSKNPENTHLFGERGTESGTPSADSIAADVELARLIDAWPNLSRSVRANIFALIESADKGAR